MKNRNESQYLSIGVKEYKKCFVGYLDILGFKEEILRTYNPETLCTHFDFVIKHIKGPCSSRDPENQDSLPVKVTWMSDNILFYTKGNSMHEFSFISNTIASLINLTIEAGPFLYRGALSEGDFYFDRKLNLYFGPAMIDAIKWEKEQNWIGAMLTPDCSCFVRANHYDSRETKIIEDRGIGTKLTEVSGPLLVEYDVPLRQRSFLEKSLCINWTVDSRANNVKATELGRVLSSLECEIERDSIEEKINNTLNFLKYCKQFEKRREVI